LRGGPDASKPADAAILDTVTATNPLLVIPSMFKAPLQYLTALLFFGLVSSVWIGGGLVIGMEFSEGFSTRSMGALFGMLGSYALLFFVTLYLLIVAVHVLGLIYVVKKDKFSWH